MERDFIDALLAIRPRLTSGEFSVALARASGHVTHFDIKRITGLKQPRVTTAERGLGTKCSAIILCIIGLTTKYNPKEAAQIVTPPSQRVLMYLLTQLGRTPVPHGADYKGFNKAYDRAYAFTGRKHGETMLLLKDVCDLYIEDFKRSKYPGSYLPRILETYVSSIPKRSKDVLENERVIGKRMRWNPKMGWFEIVLKQTEKR